MARDREPELFALDPEAVVGHADQPYASAAEIDVDAARSGVEAVFEQFLERRGGTLDHLARGDLVDQVIGQRADMRGHATRPFAHCA